MPYSEFKEMCHNAWSQKFDYLCIDKTEIEKEIKYRVFNESKRT